MRIALITGANKGIGLETARQLARDHGFTVLLGARDQTRGQEAADELKTSGLDVHFLHLDPTDGERKFAMSAAMFPFALRVEVL